jgi:hypothetical protein
MYIYICMYIFIYINTFIYQQDLKPSSSIWHKMTVDGLHLKIKTLDISGNAVKGLPIEIYTMVNLKTLHTTRCNIQRFDYIYIYAPIDVCMYIYICTFGYMYTYKCIYKYISMHTYVNTYKYIFI